MHPAPITISVDEPEGCGARGEACRARLVKIRICEALAVRRAAAMLRFEPMSAGVRGAGAQAHREPKQPWKKKDVRRFYKAQAKIRGTGLHHLSRHGASVGVVDQDGDAAEGQLPSPSPSRAVLLGNVSMDAGVTLATLRKVLREEMDLEAEVPGLVGLAGEVPGLPPAGGGRRSAEEARVPDRRCTLHLQLGCPFALLCFHESDAAAAAECLLDGAWSPTLQRLLCAEFAHEGVCAADLRAESTHSADAEASGLKPWEIANKVGRGQLRGGAAAGRREDLYPAGLHVVADVVSVEEEGCIMAALDAAQWEPLARRRVQHYGYALG